MERWNVILVNTLGVGRQTGRVSVGEMKNTMNTLEQYVGNLRHEHVKIPNFSPGIDGHCCYEYYHDEADDLNRIPVTSGM
jgi:hypothetical protein